MKQEEKRVKRKRKRTLGNESNTRAYTPLKIARLDCWSFGEIKRGKTKKKECGLWKNKKQKHRCIFAEQEF